MAPPTWRTEQERIDAMTMEIKVQTVGSGYIDLGPQKRFEKPLMMQPPTVAHKDYPEEYSQYLQGAATGSVGAVRPAPPPQPPMCAQPAAPYHSANGMNGHRAGLVQQAAPAGYAQPHANAGYNRAPGPQGRMNGVPGQPAPSHSQRPPSAAYSNGNAPHGGRAMNGAPHAPHAPHGGRGGGNRGTGPASASHGAGPVAGAPGNYNRPANAPPQQRTNGPPHAGQHANGNRPPSRPSGPPQQQAPARAAAAAPAPPRAGPSAAAAPHTQQPALPQPQGTQQQRAPPQAPAPQQRPPPQLQQHANVNGLAHELESKASVEDAGAGGASGLSASQKKRLRKKARDAAMAAGGT